MHEKKPSNRDLALATGALVLAGLMPIAATLYASENRIKPDQIQLPAPTER